MEDTRKNDAENKEDWEAPAMTVLEVDAGTEGGAADGGDMFSYS